MPGLHRLITAGAAMSVAVAVFGSPAIAQTPPTDTESWGELLPDGAAVGADIARDLRLGALVLRPDRAGIRLAVGLCGG